MPDQTNDQTMPEGEDQSAPDQNGPDETTESPATSAQDNDQDQKISEDTPLAKIRAESAARRVALREAQDQNEQLRGQVTALQDAALTAELRAHGVTLDAVKAAGHRDAAFTDAGTVNLEALPRIVADTAARFGSMHRKPSPDPNFGREPDPAGESSRATWQDLLKR